MFRWFGGDQFRYLRYDRVFVVVSEQGSIDAVQVVSEAALDAFGPERCMFGSDWPVCELAASYGQVYSALVEILGDVGEAAKRAILGETAAKFYQLKT